MATCHPSSPIGRAPDRTPATARRGGSAGQSGTADWLGGWRARAALIGGSRAVAGRARDWRWGAGCQGPVARRRARGGKRGKVGASEPCERTAAGPSASTGRPAGIGGEEKLEGRRRSCGWWRGSGRARTRRGSSPEPGAEPGGRREMAAAVVTKTAWKLREWRGDAGGNRLLGAGLCREVALHRGEPPVPCVRGAKADFCAVLLKLQLWELPAADRHLAVLGSALPRRALQSPWCCWGARWRCDPEKRPWG